ncbi:MAG: hypothetical protein HYV09_23475 [Deltaproteobacteria bacterium]|nr:hypothetical protein [Deltaproteobacteria bacterium]
MRPTAILLLVPAVALASTARADDWFGTDKALHFGVSAVIASGVYGVTTAFDDRRAVALGVGGGVALGAGIGKETWDALGHGDPSWKDFTWDVIGTIAGLALAYGVDAMVRPAPNPAMRDAAAPLTAWTFDLRPETFDPRAPGGRAMFRF